MKRRAFSPSHSRCGLEHADLPVRTDMTDAEAVLIYAAENATQRGESSTAGAGTVAAATWLLAKAIMRGSVSTIVGTLTKQAALVLEKQIASDKGIGQDIVLKFLTNTPGIQERAVSDYFANIKSCGEYARIIADVRKEIEEENKEAMRKAEENRKLIERTERDLKAAADAKRRAEEDIKAARAIEDKTRKFKEKERANEAKRRAEADAKAAEDRRKKAKAAEVEFEPVVRVVTTARKAED